MSRVFVAEERRFNRRVVVKVLSPELAAEVSAERFEREIRVAAKLQDPRIVPVLSAGDVDGLPFYTMPFIDGTSLRERMKQGPIPLSSAISIACIHQRKPERKRGEESDYTRGIHTERECCCARRKE